ncbi:hypothetical protein FQR65_LT15333 [Abscondita terminalis]|nr:hypothetical protein FQR65_LT15333 [Abscondita terminalis]
MKNTGGISYFEDKKIATSYPKILTKFFQEQNINVQIEEIGGSVEIAPSIGLANAIFDIVSTGSTLLTNGLKQVETVMKSEAVLVADVKSQKDKALIDYTKKFDKANLTDIRVSSDEINAAIMSVSEELKQAIQMAASNIEKFHASQKESKNIIETAEGVNCWREARPIENVGIYIPGGSAPLFSTVLMLGIPAQLAGCKNIILCTDATHENGNINPLTLYS